MFGSVPAQRAICRITWIMAWFATVAGQLHALARFAVPEHQEDLELPLTRAWAVPTSEALRPLLDWAAPDTVYLTYGKIWLPVFAVLTLCAFVVHQRRQPVGFEKWAWRVALTGYVLATASVFGDYFTPWLDQSFLFVGMPGLLLTALGSTTLGIALLRKGFRPLPTGILLAAFIPLFLAITQVTSMGSAILPVVWAWAIAGRRVSRELTTPTAAAAQARPAASRRPV